MAEPSLASSRLDIEEDALFEKFYSDGYTDGLPIVPPTEGRVRAMIEGSGLDPQRVVATMTPSQAEVTAEKLAVNAVMAGCRPEYMPVLCAAVRAMVRPAHNLDAIQVSTHPVAPLLLINGPIRKSLEINSEGSALGSGTRANATIGRALRLAMVNLGGATPGVVSKSTQGQPGRFTFCCGENEEESPWEPLHVQRGLRKVQSAVTVIAAGGTCHIFNGSADGKDVLKSVTYGMIAAATNNVLHPEGEPLLLLSPSHAQAIAQAGYSREALQKHLFEHARAPWDWMSEDAKFRLRRGSSSFREGEALPFAEHWSHFIIAVVGGPGGLHSTFVPTLCPSKSQTEPIE